MSSGVDAISKVNLNDDYCTPERSIGGLLETPIDGDAIDGVDIIVNDGSTAEGFFYLSST